MLVNDVVVTPPDEATRPQYAARLKSGTARGGEAVVMAENVRSYHDILLRMEPAHAAPLSTPGLRLGQRD